MDANDQSTVSEGARKRNAAKWKAAAAKETGRTLRKFGSTASTHGVKSAVASKGALRLFWVAIFVLSLAACLIILVVLLQEYLRYDTEVSTTLSYPKGGVRFPAVTVCSLNPYKKSLLYESPELTAMQHVYDVKLEEIDNRKMEEQKHI